MPIKVTSKKTTDEKLFDYYLALVTQLHGRFSNQLAQDIDCTNEIRFLYKSCMILKYPEAPYSCSITRVKTRLANSLAPRPNARESGSWIMEFEFLGHKLIRHVIVNG